LETENATEAQPVEVAPPADAAADLLAALAEPPSLTPPELAQAVTVSPSMRQVERGLLAMWRSDPEGRAISEHRALTLGRLAGYLEGVMLTNPTRLPELGALYTRLVAEERRCWEDERAARTRALGRSATGQTIDLAARGDSYSR
jgi:hypothetical protein